MAMASSIGSGLIARLMRHFSPDQHFTEGAVVVMDELLTIYIKEAVLRAQAAKEVGAGGMTMLEKDDLEAVLGQMVVDFT